MINKLRVLGGAAVTALIATALMPALPASADSSCDTGYHCGWDIGFSTGKVAMMVDDSTVAPVVCQPAAPFIGLPGRAADLNLSPADADVVRRRAADGCSVLGIRYASDPAVGTRFDTLTSLIGDAFIRVELEGSGHSTVTEHRSQAAVDAVLAFFGERLH